MNLNAAANALYKNALDRAIINSFKKNQVNVLQLVLRTRTGATYCSAFYAFFVELRNDFHKLRFT